MVPGENKNLLLLLMMMMVMMMVVEPGLLVQCHSAEPDLLPSTAECPASSSLETLSNSFEITRMPRKSDVLYGGTE